MAPFSVSIYDSLQCFNLWLPSVFFWLLFAEGDLPNDGTLPRGSLMTGALNVTTIVENAPSGPTDARYTADCGTPQEADDHPPREGADRRHLAEGGHRSQQVWELVVF